MTDHTGESTNGGNGNSSPARPFTGSPIQVVVIGGGFAGLSAATALAQQGCRVTVVEGRQILGGRAYSFTDPRTRNSVDNGQHLLMGCYDETFVFLRRIEALSRVQFQPSLHVDFIGDGGREASLHCLPFSAPWHIASGVWRLSTLSFADRLRLRHVKNALERTDLDGELDSMTIDQWLTLAKQSERAKQNLWNLIAIAAINEDPSIASALGFVQVLRRAFFQDWPASRGALSSVGLSDLYVHSAKEYIESRGGIVLVKSPVQRLSIEDGRVREIALRDGARLWADWVISAVPPPALLKFLPKEVVAADPKLQGIERLTFAPIISIHLWFDRPILDRQFAALLNTHIQWIFNKSKILTSGADAGYVSLVISGAHEFEGWEEQRILTLALEELRRLLPSVQEAALVRSIVIKEHQATLSPVPGTESRRPMHQTQIANFLLAGDWTRTGLPATIESACTSGHRCADLVLNQKAVTAAVSHPGRVTHV